MRRERHAAASGQSAGGTSPRWGRRIGWLVGLWAAGVALLGLASWLLKGFMRWAGLTA